MTTNNDNCKQTAKIVLGLVRYFDKHKMQARVLIISIAFSLTFISIAGGVAIITQVQKGCVTDFLKSSFSHKVDKI